MVLQVFRAGSLLLAIGGLAVLLVVAGHSQAPTVQVGRLAETMNWAYVRMEGAISRQPSYDAVEGDLQFWLWDGTGDILILAAKPAADVLLSQDLVPVIGDRVSLEGTLRVRDEFPYLFLNDPHSMRMQPSPPLSVTVAEAAALPPYRKVEVRGVVRAIREPYAGLWILTVRDATGEIAVSLSSGAITLGGAGPEWSDPKGEGSTPDGLVGQTIQFVAGVDRFKGEPQLSIGRAGDLVVLSETLALADFKRIGEFAEQDLGSLVVVEGTITEVVSFSGGVKYTIDDGSGTAAMLLWQDIALPDRGSLIPGAMVRVQGELAEYGGELEVVPQVPSDVVVLPVVKPHPNEVPTGSSRGMALLTEPTAGPDVTLATVTIPAVSTHEVGLGLGNSEKPPATVEAGRDSNAPGEHLLNGTSVPQRTNVQPAPASTQVILPTPPTRSLGSIAGSEVGKVLTIQAGIVDVTFFSKGIKATLDDGSGRIILLLWQNVLEEISDRYDLVPGSRLRVTGEVVDYEGQGEIIPHQGEQVVVLARGQRLPTEQRALSDITPSDEGRIFSVEGAVIRTEGGPWLRLVLKDGTGEMPIFVPERMVEYLPRGISAGMRLRVTGEVDIYKGMLEIIPLAGADVEVR